MRMKCRHCNKLIENDDWFHSHSWPLCKECDLDNNSNDLYWDDDEYEYDEYDDWDDEE